MVGAWLSCRELEPTANPMCLLETGVCILKELKQNRIPIHPPSSGSSWLAARPDGGRYPVIHVGTECVRARVGAGTALSISYLDNSSVTNCNTVRLDYEFLLPPINKEIINSN